MSSKKNQELLYYLKDLDLEDYYEAFQQEKLTFSDLEFLEPSDIESVIPKGVHRRKFLKSLESLRSKKKGPGRDETKQKIEGVRSKNEGEHVQTSVKCKQEVGKIYDIPLCITNEELIGKLLHVENAKLKSKLGELEKVMEESLEKVQKEAAAMENKRLKMENKRLKKDLKRALMVSKSWRSENKKLKRDIKKAEKKMKMMIDSSVATAVPQFKSQRGILVPQNVVFKGNRMYRAKLKQVLSNGNKVAKGIGGGTVCFKTSAIFTAGKMSYFQVTAYVRDGMHMGFGIMSGAVKTYVVGDHEKGWSYNCYPGGKPKRIYHNSQRESGYGPKRTLGKHRFGIFCDFTNGKGEVSFIVDGKNWGVAYKNVEPPVSPAFYVYTKKDSFKIEEPYKVPDFV